MRVIITGATGAIGHALIEECLQQNIEVTVFSHSNSNRTDELCKLYKNRIQIKNIGLQDFKAESVLITQNANQSQYDYFFHLAWMGTTGAGRNDASLQGQNVQYALDAVELAHNLGCKAFVFVGSQAEYGQVEGMLTAETKTNPETEYGKAKLEAGIKTRDLCGKLGLKHIYTRVLSVYGPHDGKQSMVMQAIHNMKNGVEAKFTKGEQQWDYLYSGDAAKALLLLAKEGKDGEIYPLGSGQARPLAEYIFEIRDQVQSEARISLGAIPYADHQVMHLCADISNLVADTGFRPETEFKEGIRKILETIDE